MGKPIRSLLWKEWHEQRWKLALGSVILAGLAGVGLQARIVSDMEVIYLAGFVGCFLWPIFVAMGLVAYERGEGSLHSLLALPVQAGLVLGLKLLLGAVACLVPLAVSALITLLIAGGREVPVAEILARYATGGVVALCLMFWTVCFGVRQPGEARASLVGVVLMLVFFLSVSGAGHRFWGHLNPLFVLRFSGVLPLALRGHSPGQAIPTARELGIFLLVQSVIAVSLFLLAVVRLPRQAPSRI